MAKKERVYDELLCFLSEPMFQIPVKSFMDENCLSMPMHFPKKYRYIYIVVKTSRFKTVWASM